MTLPIGQIVELIGPDGAKLLGQPARNMHVIAGVFIGLRRHEPQIGADHAQEIDLLAALRLRHDDDRAITQRIAHQGQPDAGVAGGALDDGAAGLENAAPLGVGDDGEAGAVLHRAARVHELGLGENGAAGCRRGAAQMDQRGVADGAEQAIDVAGCAGRRCCVHACLLMRYHAD